MIGLSDRLAFRCALRNAAQTRRFAALRQRVRLLAALDDQPELFDLAALDFASRMAPEVVGAAGDTPVLDKIGQWFKWIIDNQDEVLRFIFALLDKIVELVNSLT